MEKTLHSIFAPVWDGNHVWIQWCAGYRVGIRVRYRTPGGEWRKWMEIGNPWPIAGNCFKLPSHREGDELQVQVGGVDGSPEWEFARCAEIIRTKAQFSVTSQSPIRLHPSAPVAALIRGEMAAFVVDEEVLLDAGTATIVMRAAQPSPYNQLIEPGEFRSSPELGAVIENLTPTSACFAVHADENNRIAAMSPEGVMAVYLGPVVNIPA